MNNTLKQINIFILLIAGILVISSHYTDAKETKFELKKKPPQEKTEEKPLFDLLNSNAPSLKTSNQNDNKWGNNPFFKQQPAIKIPEKKTVSDAPQELDLYEYKINAIWKVNDEYKALVSGHIIKKGDKINEVTILKITEKDITVSRKTKKRSFRLGSIFYDFQI